jgi:chemotaxis response regulator CheB
MANSGESMNPCPEDRAEISEVVTDAAERRGYQMLPIVGLGGSAGSLAALRTFFEMMPANSGMAFVVILHLSPEHESLMAEILQRSSTMPVVEVRMEEEKSHVNLEVWALAWQFRRQPLRLMEARCVPRARA